MSFKKLLFHKVLSILFLKKFKIFHAFWCSLKRSFLRWNRELTVTAIGLKKTNESFFRPASQKNNIFQNSGGQSRPRFHIFTKKTIFSKPHAEQISFKKVLKKKNVFCVCFVVCAGQHHEIGKKKGKPHKITQGYVYSPKIAPGIDLAMFRDDPSTFPECILNVYNGKLVKYIHT